MDELEGHRRVEVYTGSTQPLTHLWETSGDVLSVGEDGEGAWSYVLTYRTDTQPAVPVELRISLKPQVEIQALSIDVVRRVPLRQLQQKAEEVLTPVLEFHTALVRRFKEVRDYALLAADYVRVVEQGHRHPVTTVARALGVTRDTLNARLRRARELGLLTGKRPPRLTPAAQKLLEMPEE